MISRCLLFRVPYRWFWCQASYILAAVIGKVIAYGREGLLVADPHHRPGLYMWLSQRVRHRLLVIEGVVGDGCGGNPIRPKQCVCLVAAELSASIMFAGHTSGVSVLRMWCRCGLVWSAHLVSCLTCCFSHEPLVFSRLLDHFCCHHAVLSTLLSTGGWWWQCGC